MNPIRKYTEFMDVHLSHNPKITLHYNRPIDEEIFSSLQYLSEIEEVGYDFVRSYGVSDKRKIKTVFSFFQAFIRQGKTFYQSASSLEYRAQPLFYYYSFINLVKAYLCLKNPSIFNQKLYHGLYHIHNNINFKKQTIKTHNGIFSEFYKQITGRLIPIRTPLNITSLFGYISDINYEFRQVGYGPTKFTAGISKLFSNNNSKKVWPCLAVVKNDELFSNKKYFRNFLSFFDHVEAPNKMDANNTFKIAAAKLKMFAFFQSKNTYNLENNTQISQITPETIDVVKNYIVPISTKSEFDFFLFMPLRKNLQIYFNEILASYVIMFYLGSLVRYSPEYLEKLLNSKHSWMIENFTRSASISFLRSINNLIQKKVFVYTSSL